MSDTRDLKKRIMDNLRAHGISTCQAFCVAGCPIHQDNRSWLYLYKHGQMKAALDSLLAFNPLPSSVSRVCAKFCEKEANQFCGITCCGSINPVEKYLGDWARQNRYKRYRFPIFRKEKVAVIGAGPAGLTCAYQLWHLGFGVTVFEKMEKPGGLLYFGISEERMPNEILLDEIHLHLAGVEIKTETEINVQDFLRFNDYDAIVIATGHSSSKKLDIPGENLPNVFGSIDFLSDLNIKTMAGIRGKEVMVIGGGETSIEVVNTVINFGGKAKIIYRRGPDNLGFPGEMVKDIEFHLIPREIQRSQTGRLAIKLERFSKEKPEVPEFAIRESDIIVLAIGQKPKEEINAQDFISLESSGIFIAGDLYHGQKSVAHAIGSGNETAGKIYRFLKIKSPAKKRKQDFFCYIILFFR